VVELWFAGVHCDVGGGYLGSESGLGNVTLQWMQQQSAALPEPVFFDQERVNYYLPATDTKEVVRPNALAGCHESLKWFWWPLELLPRTHRVKDANGDWHTRWKIPFGRRRRLEAKQKVHHSVQQRIAAGLFDRAKLPQDIDFV
jgi:hypothetical protein